MMQYLEVYAVVFTSPSVSSHLAVSGIYQAHFFSAAGNGNVDSSGDSPARVASANTVGA